MRVFCQIALLLTFGFLVTHAQCQEPQKAPIKHDSMSDQELVRAYIHADAAGKEKIVDHIKKKDSISGKTLKVWVDLIQKELATLPKCAGEKVFTLQHAQYPMKYRIIENPKTVDDKSNGDRKKSLLILLHGGGGNGKINEGQWKKMTSYWKTRKFDLLCYPRCLDPATKKLFWPWIQGSAMISLDAMIKEILRTYPVDTNRVYVAGVSMGAEGTIQFSCAAPDRLAGAGAMAGGMVDGTNPDNLMNTPITIHVGVRDTKNGVSIIARAQRMRDILKRCLQKHPEAYKFDYREYDTGHQLPGTAKTEIVNWLAPLERNPVPRKIRWRPSFKHKRYFYWLKLKSPQRNNAIYAHIKENRIDVSTNVTNFTVFLDGRLADLDKKVTLFVNKEKAFHGRLHFSRSAVLETYVAKEDPEMIFNARIDFEKSLGKKVSHNSRRNRYRQE